jgi:5-methylcytosine-specific restriction endonuclease McrA
MSHIEMSTEQIEQLFNGEKWTNQFTKPQAREGYKFCARCKIEQLKTEFTKDKNRVDSLKRYCKTCCKKEREEKRDYYRAKSKEWRELHPERFRERKKVWSQKNRLQENARLRVLNAQRRRVMKADAIFEEVDYNEILERDNYICHICDGYVDPSQLQFDHVIPLDRGGEHTMDNVKVAHALCNQMKGNRLLEEL